MALRTQCPHCDKVFSLKNAATLGKKLRCPKCEEPFVVKKYKAPEEQPAEEYDYSYDDEDYEAPADDEGESEEEAPRRKSSGGSRSKSKKKTSKKGSGAAKVLIPILIGAIGLGAVGLFGWGAYFVFSKLGGRNIVNMQYFPEETEMLFHVRPADMWNAPLLADVRNNPAVAQQMKEAQQGLDIQVTDIDSVTIGVTNIAQRQMFNRFSGVATGPMASAGPQQTLGVMRLTRDITAADMEKIPGATKATHGSQSLQVRQNGFKQVTQWLASPRLVVFGDDALVKAAIDRGSKEFRFKHFDIGSTKNQFMMVAAPRGEAKPASGGLPGSLDAVMNQHAKGMYLGLSLTSEVVMDSKVTCFSSEGATAIKAEFDKGINQAKQQLTGLNPLIASQIQPLIAVGNETLNSLKVTASGSNVNVEGRISNKIVDAFKQLSSNPMFSGMMGGGMNPPPPNTPNMPMPPVSPGTDQ